VGKSTARISAFHNGLSAFRPNVMLACYQQARRVRKVINVRQKYEPLIYPDPRQDKFSQQKLRTRPEMCMVIFEIGVN
jgi:hypothetical protein